MGLEKHLKWARKILNFEKHISLEMQATFGHWSLMEASIISSPERQSHSKRKLPRNIKSIGNGFGKYRRWESRSQRIGTTVDRRKDGEASSHFIIASPFQISTESAPTYLTELPAHEKSLIPGQKKEFP